MRKNYVFVIVGKFAAGKTTIAKLLEERYGLKRAVTCTTRKMREGEREGIDYYYCSDYSFEEMASKGKLVAINRVPIVYDKNENSYKHKYIKRFINKVKKNSSIRYSKKYGLPIDKIDLNSNSYIVVLEPSGYYDLVNKLGKENVKVIYLNLSDKERWLRALNREVNPDVDGIVAKHLEEKELYDGFENISDKIINNAGTSDNAAIEVYQYISSLIEKQ